MAFAAGPALLISTDAVGIWRWVAAHAVPMLIGIYFFSLACVLVLSLYIVRLSRRLAHLRGDVDRDSRLLNELAKSAKRGTPEKAGSPAEIAPPPASVASEPSGVDRSAVRREVESVLSDMWADSEASVRER